MLFAEQTTVPVVDQGRRRIETGPIWAYARDHRTWGGTDPAALALIEALDRKSERSMAHLAEFSGMSVADASCSGNIITLVIGAMRRGAR
ncbi:IS66 family transposase [Glacieibacterium megasporae]|uniref:IS66 family transposase n=1 Tax=Glacieibacterium megasporae TaxID=2835787 RepID=UPI001C1DDC5C|nr:transposase [Polymorphobacter megasporae]UAJ12687.1 IS66 family transposase [Polymorphobacter megasporae]